jgi:hypothetical protein
MGADQVYWDKYDPSTGRLVRYLPHRYRDGKYRMMPRRGRTSHHSENAIAVDTLQQVIERLRTGQYCLRMSPNGRGSAVRVCPPSIVISAVNAEDNDALPLPQQHTIATRIKRTSRQTRPSSRSSSQKGTAAATTRVVSITMGLVIHPRWLEKILNGEKIWEIRSKSSTRADRIALCEGGGPIVGTCTIKPSIALSREEFRMNFDKHRVSEDELVAFYGDRQIYAWPVSDVRRLARPICYKHPGGGSWVRLCPKNVAEFNRLQSC